MALLVECQNSKKLEAKKSNEEGMLMNIPSDLILEILSWLPARIVIKCRLVCKKFLNLISTHEFVSLHLARSNPSLVIFREELYGQVCQLVEFEDESDYHYLYCNPAVKFELGVLPAKLISSLNGLVCFYHPCNDKHREAVYICNPITREYIILPFFEGSIKYVDKMAFGFGVSMVSGQYKIVRISFEWDYDEVTEERIGLNRFECSVYTLGKGSWRIIESVKLLQSAYDFGTVGFCAGLFFNGNIHWLVENFGGSKLISCFDLENESFHFLPPPDAVKGDITFFCSLGVLADSLCLCDNTSDSHAVIWVMKENGARTSWTKEFVINKMLNCPCSPKMAVHALNIFKDGDILFVTQNVDLFCYNNQSKTSETMETIHSYKIQSVLHVSSFLSLEEFAVEKVMKF